MFNQPYCDNYSMKQLQIIVRPSKVNDVMDSLRKADVGGLTLCGVRGMGRAEPPLVGDTYSMEQISVTVDDDKVSEVFDTVSKVGCTGQKGDGKVFVTDVVDALDLCTKKTGSDAI